MPKMNILYIEDNPDDVTMIREMLSESSEIDFVLDSVSMLKDGLAKAAKSTPDLLLLDLGLPDSQGVEAVTKIAQVNKYIPIIVLTGNNDEHVGIKAVELGAQDYLVKELIHSQLLVKTIQYADVRFKLATALSHREEVLRKKAEEQLSVASKRLMLATEGANIGIWEFDPVEGTLIWDTKMLELHGHKGKEFDATLDSWLLAIHPEDRNEIERILKEAILSEKPSEMEFRVILPDGDIRHMRQVAMKHREDGESPKLIGANWDVTKEKEAVLKKFAAEKSKTKQLEQFAYIASHDLQEPLRTVRSFTTVICEDYGELFDDEGQNILNAILVSTRRMSDLINGLLNYSKIGRSSKLSDISLKKVIDDIQSDLSTVLEEQNAKIELGFIPEHFNGYVLEIRQLIQNLITNATKFQRPGVSPRIKIDSSEYSHHWQFSVSDNGIGMEAKYLDRIFEIFQRLHNTNDYAGTGIGLAYCKKIVELHEGEIWVESEVGKGSTFHFTVSKHLGEMKYNYYENKIAMHHAH